MIFTPMPTNDISAFILYSNQIEYRISVSCLEEEIPNELKTFFS